MRIMAISNAANVISNMMKIPSNSTIDPRNLEPEEVNMNYIFKIEDSLTKRRPMYVRKIASQQYPPGKYLI